MPSPQTRVMGGNGTQTVSYELAPGVFQYIESVLVEVNNTAGGDIRPKLSVTTQDGQVMATKRQGETIPAGDTGTATWALRLSDEAAQAGAGLETARATWTPAEVLAGATKTLLPARPGTIVYPADFLMTPTINFNPVWGAGQPQLLLESSGGTQAWMTFDIPGGGGGGQWVSWSTMIGEFGLTPWTDQITGEGLRATVIPNDLMTVTTGTLAAFVTARRIVWTA